MFFGSLQACACLSNVDAAAYLIAFSAQVCDEVLSVLSQLLVLQGASL